MARDGTTSNSDQTKDYPAKSLLERRSYLKMAGLAVSTVAASAAVSDTAAAAGSRTLNVSDGDEISSALEGIDDGETVHLPEGKYHLRNNATISADNVTIDGRGARVVIHGHRWLRIRGANWDLGRFSFVQTWSSSDQLSMSLDGSNWRLHDCAWKGKSTGEMYLISPSVEHGSTGEIDRCWFGDGCPLEEGSSSIFAYNNTSGVVNIRRSYFYRGGVYGVDSQQPPKMDGVVNYEQCYFENPILAALRCGSPNHTGHVTDCTIVYTDIMDSPMVGSASNLSDPTSRSARGVWAWWGDVVVENCEIENPFGPAIVTQDSHGSPSVTVSGGNVSGSPRARGNISIDSDVGTDPDTTPPEGCVTSVEDAISGESSGSSSSSSASLGGEWTPTSSDPALNTLSFEGTGEPANYAFSVDGDVAEAGNSLEEWDTAAGEWGDGFVTSTEHVDSYAISGSLSDLSFEKGEADIYLNGVKITPEEATEAKALTIEGTGEPTNYTFSVDGVLKGSKGSLEKYDSVSKTGASGYLTAAGTVDEFVILGDLADLSFEKGEANVYVDGKEIDPKFMDARSLKVEGLGEPTQYEFSVSGVVRGRGDSLEQWDSVSDTSAVGHVTDEGSVDTYQFTGDLTDFAFEKGEATVYVDGEKLDVAASDRRTLEIEGLGEPTQYAFSVDGSLSTEADSIERWDSVSDTSATGHVTGEGSVDTYYFTGELTDFGFEKGEANVYVDGETFDVAAASPRHTLEIEGLGEPTQYAFSVDGSLSSENDTIERWDSVSDASATGYVTGEGSVDAYEFTGELTDFAFEKGEANVYVDGKEINPTTSGSKTLKIRGAGEPTKYVFRVSDSLQAHGDTIEQWDDVSTDAAAGYVTNQGSADVYEFTGELTDFAFEKGRATVTVDGEELDSAAISGAEPEPQTHTLEIRGAGEATQYTFSVDGSLSPESDTIERWDSVSDTSADGYVTGESNADTYVYSGSVTEFEFVKGNATVFVDGTETAPDQLLG